MSRWNADEHATDPALFLHLDGELTGRESARIRRHLTDCWQCRARYERLKRRTCEFAELREDAQVGDFPSAKARQRFLRHLRTANAEATPRVVRRRRAVWLTSGVSAAVTGVLLALTLMRPPAMTASEFLRRAQRAVTLAPAQVAVQRVRLRQGSRTVEQDVRRGGRHVASAVPTEEWRDALALAAVDWNDPLDAASFVHWHDRQLDVRDQVTENSDSVTLVTSQREGGTVRSASLVVRRADWRPIAKHFEFRDRPPLEISEVRYTVRLEDVEVKGEDAPATVLPGRSTAPPTSLPGGGDLERAEIGVREVLHALNADRVEAPEIVRRNMAIDVRGVADGEERRKALTAALFGIPFVHPDIQVLGATASSGADTQTSWQAADAPLYTSDPPFARPLWDLMGGMDEANRYLELARALYGRAHANVMAFDRLAKRYNGPAWEELPPDVRARVDRVAGDLAEAVRTAGREYLALITPPVTRLGGHGTTLSPEVHNNPDVGQCADWRTLTLPGDLNETHTSFRRMFVVEQSTQPISERAPELLLRHLEARRRFLLDLESLCPADLGHQ